MTRSITTSLALLGLLACTPPVFAQPQPADAADAPPPPPAPAPAPAPVAVVEGAEQAPAAQSVPYVGLVLVPTTPEARAQLKLADGVGLTVMDVAPESPAEEAGLQRHDVVHKLDDQIIVNPQQMGTLIRMHGTGAKVTLSVYRAGQTVKVPIEIGSTQRRDAAQAVRHQIRFAPGGVQVVPLDEQGGMMVADEEIEARARQIEAQLERIREEMQRHQGLGNDARQRIEQLLEQAQEARQGQGNVPRAGVTRAMRIADGEHVIEIRQTNDDKTLKVSDPDGNVIFDGPINTDEQRAAVPADVLEKVEKLEKRANVRIQINRQAAPAPAEQEPDEHQLN